MEGESTFFLPSLVGLTAATTAKTRTGIMQDYIRPNRHFLVAKREKMAMIRMKDIVKLGSSLVNARGPLEGTARHCYRKWLLRDPDDDVGQRPK